MRAKIAAGNWKMFKTYDEALAFMQQIKSIRVPKDVLCILSPSFPYLRPFVEGTREMERVCISAQNCHQEASGAFTGEVSAPMLASLGVEYVIIGHSERREQQGESNELLRQKVRIALDHGLKVIFCCGESLEIRKSGRHIEYVSRQLSESLGEFSEDDLKNIILAYEPIWAIGTGETATPEQAQEMHEALRNHLGELFSEDLAGEIPILYGGSVKPSNARDLFANEDVDGGLVGGASLDADSFGKIIHSF